MNATPMFGFFLCIVADLVFIIKDCPVEQEDSEINFYVRKITRLKTDQLRQEGTSGDHLVQPPSQSRVSQNRLLRAMPSQVFHISRDGESATALGKR